MKRENLLLKEFKKLFKKFSSLDEIKHLVPLIKQIETCDVVNEKITRINNLLEELYVLQKSADKQVRRSKLALIFSKNNSNYIAKMNYNMIYKKNNDKIYALLRFEHLLYSTLNDLKQNCNNVDNDR